MSPEGVKFRTSRLERHSPVRTGKQLGCNFCSYVVMTEQSTGGKRVQMKRRRKGGTATTKCSACHVHAGISFMLVLYQRGCVRMLEPAPHRVPASYRPLAPKMPARAVGMAPQRKAALPARKVAHPVWMVWVDCRFLQCAARAVQTCCG